MEGEEFTKITFTRNSNLWGAIYSINIYVNGKKMASLWPTQSKSISLFPGSYNIEAEHFAGIRFFVTKEIQITNTGAGEHIAILCGPKLFDIFLKITSNKKNNIQKKDEKSISFDVYDV